MTSNGFGAASGTVSGAGGASAGLRSLVSSKRPDLAIVRFTDLASPPGAAATSTGPQSASGHFGKVTIYVLRSTGALVAVKELTMGSLDPDSMRECVVELPVLQCYSVPL